MTDVMKGNYRLKTQVEAEARKDDLESRFERQAMQKLGGSIAFVAKKKVNWDTK